MNSLVFVTGILFGLHFVAYPCEGLVSIVNDTKYVLPGDDVRIEWSITNPVSDLTFRAWNFVEAKELLATINNKDELTIEASSLPGIKVEKPSTLILENVDEKYNGTYSFQYNAKTVGDNTGISHVTVIVQASATILINCSSSTIVDEDSDVRCLCEGKDGNPPAKVRWYDKDGTKIGVEEDEKKMLTLNNVDGTYNGTYKCVARSHTLTPEKSIEVKVLPNFQPKVIELTFEFRGESVIITCVAIARPSPTRYIILHNGKERYNDTGKTLTIKRANDSYSGLYTCIAWNKLGESPPKSFNLTASVTPVVITSFTSKPEKAVLGEPVTIICEAIGRPSPNYLIFHNGTKKNTGTESTYFIQKMEFTHVGLYECIVENKLGSSSKTYKLTVVEKETSNKSNCSDGGTKWYIFLLLLVSGIIIGAAPPYIVGYYRRRFRNRKPQSNPEPETSKVNSIYQDLDLTKMNSEDNYQSLKVNSGRNDADYENQNDSTYTELSKVRDMESNYQSLI